MGRVRELKRQLAELGVDYSDCIELSDLERLLSEEITRRQQAASHQTERTAADASLPKPDLVQLLSLDLLLKVINSLSGRDAWTFLCSCRLIRTVIASSPAKSRPSIDLSPYALAATDVIAICTTGLCTIGSELNVARNEKEVEAASSTTIANVANKLTFLTMNATCPPWNPAIAAVNAAAPASISRPIQVGSSSNPTTIICGV